MIPSRVKQMTEVMIQTKRLIGFIKSCLEEFINVNGHPERRKPGKRIASLEENFKRLQEEEIIILSFNIYQFGWFVELKL